MSTETTAPAPHPSSAAARAGTRLRRLEGRPGVPFGRTLQAELRKMVDTRAGRWMVIVMAALAVLILAAFVIWGPAEDATFDDLLRARHAAARDAAAGHRHHGRDRRVDPAHRAGHLHPRAAARPRRARQGAGRPRPRAWSSRRSPSPRQPSPTSSAGTGEWDLDAAAGGGLVLALLHLRPAGRRVRAAVPQHARSPSSRSWSCPRSGPSPRRSSARSRTSAGGSTWTRSPVRCSPGRWRARTGPSSAPASRVWVLLPLAVGT